MQPWQRGVFLRPDVLEHVWRLFVGYEGDRCVATAAAWVSDAVTIVEMVSVRDRVPRQGLRRGDHRRGDRRRGRAGPRCSSRATSAARSTTGSATSRCCATRCTSGPVPRPEHPLRPTRRRNPGSRSYTYAQQMTTSEVHGPAARRSVVRTHRLRGPEAHRRRCRPRRRRDRGAAAARSSDRDSRTRRAGRRRRHRPRRGTNRRPWRRRADPLRSSKSADQRVPVAHRAQQEAGRRAAVLRVPHKRFAASGAIRNDRPEASLIVPAVTAIPFTGPPFTAAASDWPPATNDTGGHSRRRKTMATATKSDAGTLESLLGDDASSLLEHTCKTVAQGAPHLPGPDFVDRIWAQCDRSRPRAAQPRSALRHGRLGGHRLPLDPAGRPGHRALGRRVVRPQPRLLRPARTSSSWPSRAAATRSPSTFGVLGIGRAASTRTRSRSSSRSTTTSC